MTIKDRFISPVDPVAATIASGESLSDSVVLGGLRLCGIIMPSSWTDANLTFQVSIDNVTYQDFYDQDGNEVTIATVEDGAYYLDPIVFATWPYVKVRSGSTTTPVNQAADREITLVLRSV